MAANLLSDNEIIFRLAPQDVRIVPYIDRDDLVHATIQKVGRPILEGIALVFIVLLVFLGSPRSALVVEVTIPLALVSVFSLLTRPAKLAVCPKRSLLLWCAPTSDDTSDS